LNGNVGFTGGGNGDRLEGFLYGRPAEACWRGGVGAEAAWYAGDEGAFYGGKVISGKLVGDGLADAAALRVVGVEVVEEVDFELFPAADGRVWVGWWWLGGVQ